MRLLASPVALRMGLLLLSAFCAFFFGWFVFRRLRKSLTTEPESLTHTPLATEGLPVHAYHAVIQQLKQQKHELAAQQLSERRKAKASDSLSSAVLANLPSGVLFLNTAGLVRQANSAARSLLGFASPAGLDVSDLFRTAIVRSVDGVAAHTDVKQALAPALSGKSAVRGLFLNYVSRAGENRVLEVTASPVMADDATLMGTTLVLSDKTDIERIRHDQRVHREISHDMAEELRHSLATIAGCAQQLAQHPDAKAIRHLADNIAAEAAKLDRTIGSFLEAREAAATSS